MVSISTDIRPHEVIEDVWFGDEEADGSLGPYQFAAGPLPDLLSAYLIDDDDEQTTMIVRAKFRWVKDGFHADDWAEVQAALDDPSNPLRTLHVLNMYAALLEEVGKRPPTSPSGSSRQPSKKPGGAKPKRKESTSGD